ncbi:MAG: XRE family transcriptional regulator [Planctomycetes bacterium]|nr:XRE family transcriptional regulator [Planctomycetota bacterium]
MAKKPTKPKKAGAKKNNGRKSSRTSNAVEILHKLVYEGRPDRIETLEEERANAAVARKICDLRVKNGLSQRELAEQVGTTASVICRLEDADYEGHSLAMLRRIAAALDHRVDVRFVRRKKTRKKQTA